jgi:hypothetical protein
MRRRQRKLVLRGGLPLLLALAAAIATATVAATLSEALLPGVLAVAVLILTWGAFAIRMRRKALAWTGRPGNDPPGGAGVREPRRPRPQSPAGAAELPSDDGYPVRALAVLLQQT